MKQYLLIDIGGTFIKYSLADEQARKISGGKVPTPLTNMDDLLAAIEGFAAPLQGQFVGCAISMPGRIDTRNGIAHTGGMLSAFMWEQPFAAQVEARLGVPVTIANDGKCAAAAEGWTGALAGVENGLVLVLGTGIGGGIILNGKVLMGAHAAAGEVSGLVSDISKMADDDFKLTSVERYSEAPLFTAALAVALCATAFAVPAFAGGGEGEPYYTETAGTEADPAEPVRPNISATNAAGSRQTPLTRPSSARSAATPLTTATRPDLTNTEQ